MARFRLILWALVALALAGVAALALLGPGGQNRPADTGGGGGPGGPFTLTAHTGEDMSTTAFAGQYRLIYFGYSFCPDVCPTELAKMTGALKDLKEDGLPTEKVKPVFVTIDPARDTVAALADYVPLFHDRLVGMTGSEQEIAEVAKLYRVYYRKVDDDSAGDYLMDHSSVIFLMNPDGSYRRIFTGDDSKQVIADALRPLLAGS
ncbi:SCO family protein [Yunchengibacter salinarum]|uniref:SCO family protein n=1 Tax=Yunchengibacter salinarum TaxID=3133399 RepID=UPI0035B67479